MCVCVGNTAKIHLGNMEEQGRQLAYWKFCPELSLLPILTLLPEGISLICRTNKNFFGALIFN